jgi:small subunit ribosomal protein S16
MGAKKRPFYRVVVADQRSPRDGRFIENIGKYHPLEDPSLIDIDEERALHWLRVGAQPSEQVQNLMSKTGIWDKFVAERPSAAARTRTNRAEAKPVAEKKSKKAKAADAAEASAPAETPAVKSGPAAEAVPVEPEPTPAAEAEPTPAAEAEPTPAAEAEPTPAAEAEPAAPEAGESPGPDVAAEGSAEA